MKTGALTKFPDIVVSVEILQHEVSLDGELFKCKAKLKDGSNLRILEKYRHDELVYYSYYWLDAANNLLVGWDRAPHHPQLKSFPHHKHLAEEPEPIDSNERNLAEVLAFIAKRLKWFELRSSHNPLLRPTYL